MVYAGLGDYECLYDCDYLINYSWVQCENVIGLNPRLVIVYQHNITHETVPLVSVHLGAFVRLNHHAGVCFNDDILISIVRLLLP